MEHVYIVKDKESGLFKIGLSKDPAQRLSGLKNKNKAFFMLASYPGNIVDEQAMHSLFSQKRVYGEWFMLSPADISNIDIYFTDAPACGAILRNWATTNFQAEQQMKARIPVKEVPRGAYAEASRRLGIQQAIVRTLYKKGRPDVVNAINGIAKEWADARREAEMKKSEIAALAAQ